MAVGVGGVRWLTAVVLSDVRRLVVALGVDGRLDDRL